MIPIVTDCAHHIQEFIKKHQLDVHTHPPKDAKVFFIYDGIELFLCTHQQRSCLSHSTLLPREPAQHPLYKMLKKQSPSEVIDATGGLGKDSLIVLASGHNTVLTYERHPVLFCALSWIHAHYPYSGWSISNQDARSHRRSGGLWLIDPMFPTHPKTAKSKGGMQIIQSLATHNPEEDADLIAHARKHADQVWLKQAEYVHKGNFGLWTVL